MPAALQESLIDGLVERGLIAPDDAALAERLSRTDTNGRGRIYHLVRAGKIDRQVLAAHINQVWKIEAFDLTGFRPDPEITRRLPRDFAVRYRMVPIEIREEQLVVVAEDPFDVDGERHAEAEAGLPIRVIAADEFTVQVLIEEGYRAEDTWASLAGEVGRNLADGAADGAAGAVDLLVRGSANVALLEGILRTGIERKASDIHIEPGSSGYRVRFRKDGLLSTVFETQEAEVGRILVRMVKVRAELDLTDLRRPQDGRISLSLGDRSVDFRVSIVRVVHGEKAVLRILNQQTVALAPEALGLRGEQREALETAYSRSEGLIVVSGPTGSGKSTTMATVLTQLNSTQVNIATVEDPVEYLIAGVNQSGVDAASGVTFATALPFLMRQDPDVLMVGETRDEETARAAVSFSKTGHLVLTTVHSIDAAGTITRLADLRADPFDLAENLSLVVAQRLLPLICEACRTPSRPDDRYLRQIRRDGAPGRTEFFRGVGCEACGGTGFRGQTGVFEVVEITDDLAEIILQGRPTPQLRDKIRRQGIPSLRQVALDLAYRGVTTLEQAIKHTPPF